MYAPGTLLLDVSNMDVRLVWVKPTAEGFEFVGALPDSAYERQDVQAWLLKALRACGGAINTSGQYPLTIPIPQEILGASVAEELVGVAEVAELLGWDKRKVSVYHSRGTLPKAITELASGPIWFRGQIEAHKQEQEEEEETMQKETYQFWRHSSGETYAVKIVDDKVVSAVGPLYYKERETVPLPDFDYLEQDAIDDGAWVEEHKDEFVLVELPGTTDMYLYLQETAHRKRYWQLNVDPYADRLIHPDKTLKVLGPALVGPDGYPTAEDAAQALADEAGIVLDNPDTWD